MTMMLQRSEFATPCASERISLQHAPTTQGCLNLMRFLLACLLLTGSLAGCAGTRDDPFAVAASTLPKKFPACEDEIRALIALTKLATQEGSNWQIFSPALDAMQEQVTDCVDDSYPSPQRVSAGTSALAVERRHLLRAVPRAGDAGGGNGILDRRELGR
jgi:hypothetical protein